MFFVFDALFALVAPKSFGFRFFLFFQLALTLGTSVWFLAIDVLLVDPTQDDFFGASLCESANTDSAATTIDNSG